LKNYNIFLFLVLILIYCLKFNTDGKIKQNAEELYEIISCIFILHRVFSKEQIDFAFQMIDKIVVFKKSNSQVSKELQTFYIFHTPRIDQEFECFHHNATAGMMFALAHRYINSNRHVSSIDESLE